MAQLGKLVTGHGVTLIIADHDCHGYQALAPRIYDFTDHHIVGLSPAASRQRLVAADKAATRQLVFAAPNRLHRTSSNSTMSFFHVAISSY